MEHKIKRPRELIRVYQKGQELQGDKFATSIEIPEIFQEMVKLAKVYGISFIKSSLNPFMDGEGRIELENFKILLQSLEIEYSNSAMNEFKYYCANQGLLTIKDPRKSLGRVLINKEKFVNEVEVHLKQLFKYEQQAQTGTDDEEENTLEKAYMNFFQAVMRTTLERIMKKIRLYEDED